MPSVDVLVPTYRRPCALAVTLTALSCQTFRHFRVVVADQSEEEGSLEGAETAAVVRVLRERGHDVELHRRERSGMAEQRRFLLARARAPFALFLDDDVVLEPDALARLVRTLAAERCGFVGMGLIGLSYADDVRRDEQLLDLWDGPVQPEVVEPDTPAWERYRLHNAANLLHAQRRVGRGDRRYKVAWIGGCVLYDVEKLRACGGFDFWRELPPRHAGEDALAQLRVMARFGGCGLLPSGAYHLELPTTLPVREVDAPKAASAASGTLLG